MFECKSKFSDGKSRAIVFVEAAMPDQETLDERSTVDSFGNAYCVTLYKNATATFVPGECGAVQPEAVTTTTLDSAAILQSLACTDGGSIFECQGVFSDGSRRPLNFLDAPPAGCLGETHALGHLGCGEACVLLQDVEDFTIELVHETKLRFSNIYRTNIANNWATCPCIRNPVSLRRQYSNGP